MDIQLYELNGIRRIETNLSQGLTTDPEQSEKIVLQRLQKLNENDRTSMQRAAEGLAKAMHYRIDRYPAIVFDGQAVVYGVTDVQTALAHYLVWRREGKR
ncbi:MAG: TIGR03757 family integrating conjugative element protein [Candidatus Thiodiazotropha sp.]